MGIVEDALGSFTFKRATGKEFPSCDACPDSKVASERTSMLQIESANSFYTLCPFHEGMLLEKMLTNYLKRRARKSHAGYVGELTKETPSA